MTVRMNWGTAIGLVYGAFVASTLGFVMFALGRPVELVSADYYSRSLTHDGRMAAAREADALEDAVRAALSGDGRTLTIVLPAGHASAAGTISLYRPSSASADVVHAIALDRDARQSIPVGRLAAGRWILKMEWTANGRRFYREQPLVLP